MSQAETDRLIQKLRDSQAETARQLRESQAETDRQLRESQAETARQRRDSRAETDRLMQELRDSQAETDRQLRESHARTARELEKLSRQATETRREMGGLANKFGSFTEGLAWPSLVKIFRDRFGLNVIGPRARAFNNGETMELDGFAYSNSGTNLVVIAEVKSLLREEHLEALKKKLKLFPRFFPGHEKKKLYGLIAAVDVPEELAQRVLREGLYLARAHDDTFELVTTDDFKPRSFLA